jgi:hypothetical protein
MTTIAAAIAEIQQTRSRFQLERFVVGQHDTPEMRFYQLCIELQDMEYKLANATLEVRKSEVQIARLRATGDEVDAIDADLKALGLEQTRLVMIGAEREVAILREMFAASPKFTRDEIEQAQPDYWRARLLRQSEFQVLQARTGIGWAQLDAHRQAGDLDVTLGALFPAPPQLELER